MQPFISHMCVLHSIYLNAGFLGPTEQELEDGLGRLVLLAQHAAPHEVERQLREMIRL